MLTVKEQTMKLLQAQAELVAASQRHNECHGSGNVYSEEHTRAVFDEHVATVHVVLERTRLSIAMQQYDSGVR